MNVSPVDGLALLELSNDAKHEFILCGQCQLGRNTDTSIMFGLTLNAGRVTNLESSPFLEEVEASPVILIVMFKVGETLVIKDMCGCNACHSRNEVVIPSKDKDKDL